MFARYIVDGRQAFFHLLLAFGVDFYCFQKMTDLATGFFHLYQCAVKHFIGLLQTGIFRAELLQQLKAVMQHGLAVETIILMADIEQLLTCA